MNAQNSIGSTNRVLHRKTWALALTILLLSGLVFVLRKSVPAIQEDEKEAPTSIRTPAAAEAVAMPEQLVARMRKLAVDTARPVPAKEQTAPSAPPAHTFRERRKSEKAPKGDAPSNTASAGKTVTVRQDDASKKSTLARRDDVSKTSTSIRQDDASKTSTSTRRDDASKTSTTARQDDVSKTSTSTRQDAVSPATTVRQGTVPELSIDLAGHSPRSAAARHGLVLAAFSFSSDALLGTFVDGRLAPLSQDVLARFAKRGLSAEGVESEFEFKRQVAQQTERDFDDIGLLYLVPRTVDRQWTRWQKGIVQSAGYTFADVAAVRARYQEDLSLAALELELKNGTSVAFAGTAP